MELHMKKTLFSTIILAISFLIVSCGNNQAAFSEHSNSSNGACMHYYKTNVNKKATCFQSGVTLYTCSKCGDSYEKIVWEEHKITDNKCSVCDALIAENLEFEISDDGKTYSVAGIGKCNSTNIIIPTEYNNMPIVSIGSNAFSKNESLQYITIPDGVKSIQGEAFQNCTSLIGIRIPNSVSSIGSRAFRRCSSLTNIVLPDKIKTVKSELFENCDSLTNVTIPNSVTIIEHSAFDGCNSLTNVTIPNSVTSIGAGAFDGCDSLLRLTIPEGVTSIEANAFRQCDSLTHLSISASVKSIADTSFNYCDSLISIEVADNNSTYHSYQNCLIDTKKKILIRGCQNSTIPTDGSVTSIGAFAFTDCKNLYQITIPDGITSIGAYAFNGSSLNQIVIPNSVTTIGYEIFGTNIVYAYCEATSKPDNWDSYWTWFPDKVYWGSEWEYVDGVPVKK